MLLIVVIIAVIVIGVVYFLSKQSLKEVSITTPKEIIPPKATGNVNDLADALIKEISDENLVLNEEDIDTALVTTDSQEINDFGQSIDESEL